MICGDMTLESKQKQLLKMELPSVKRHCQDLKKKGFSNIFYEKLLSEDHATSSPYLLIWPCTVTSILSHEWITFYQIWIQHLCLFKLEDRVFIVTSSEVQIC